MDSHELFSHSSKYLFPIQEYSHPNFLSSHLLHQSFLSISAAPPKKMDISNIQWSQKIPNVVIKYLCVKALTRLTSTRFVYKTSFISCDCALLIFLNKLFLSFSFAPKDLSCEHETNTVKVRNKITCPTETLPIATCTYTAKSQNIFTSF